MEELKTEEKTYKLNDKNFILQNDFCYDDLDWLNIVADRLSGKGNQVSGSFSKAEMFKTLAIILRCDDGTALEKTDFNKIPIETQTKILADFFLMKSIQGNIIQTLSKISTIGTEQQ